MNKATIFFKYMTITFAVLFAIVSIMTCMGESVKSLRKEKAEQDNIKKTCKVYDKTYLGNSNFQLSYICPDGIIYRGIK